MQVGRLIKSAIISDYFTLDKLDRLEQEGVIRQVDYSEWAMPIFPVLKPSGQESAVIIK